MACWFPRTKCCFFLKSALAAVVLLVFWPEQVSSAEQAQSADQSPPGYFGVRVIDAQTGRGVPLVELRTVHEVSYWTDSAGWAAIGEPELMNREVYFHVRSHGYTLPADGFGFRGVRLLVRPGGRATIRLERQNVAERLYRITGAGIYQNSFLLGQPTPGNTPLVRADVAGQDSVQAAVYRGRIYWFWGDTNRLVYPLGNFRTTGATSPLPGQAGFDPNVSVPLEYFTGPDGRCKNMCPFEPAEGMIWIDGLVVVPDPKEGEKLIAHYARMKSLGEMLEHGLAIWNDQNQEFRLWVRFPKQLANRTLLGHPFRHQGSPDPARSADSEAKEKGKQPLPFDSERPEYIYCGLAFPNIRVRATLETIADPAQYETWTCLEETSLGVPTKEDLELSGGKSQSSGQLRLPLVKRDPAGNPLWRWSRSAPPISPAMEHRLVRAGQLRLEETYFLPVDVQSGKPVEIHSGSVRWNPWRKRWILIGVQQGGNSSFLGEVWYAEADNPVGPWRRAVKIVTHDRYSFYNPVHHDFLDQQGGRIIFFEGTYSHSFSGNPTPTPRYDYNQIMYRLDLADPRLQPAQK
ncbi:MAG: DUF4185 domain-containing protein [Thermoguttaceae bacterium]|nr:DUF4185 domain-containing protein [Thermoguttaceae bacterium]MDW8037916.1 hypothetical protein [Thermoguttaceae bacterium]